MNKRLYRSRQDSWLGGVAGGIAEYFEIDPTIVRLIWLLAIFMGGTGVLAYLVAWILIPANPVGPSDPRFERTEHWRESVIETARGVEQRFRKDDEGPRPAGSGSTSGPVYSSGGSGGSTSPRQVFGWLLVILGALLLLQKLIPWGWIFIRTFWPVVLVVLGIVLVLQEVRR